MGKTSRNRRRTQAEDIERRVRTPAPYPPERCTIMGCNRLTQRSAGKGLSEVLCKPHSEHLRRHGHETRKSYSKAELTPYRQAVREWMRQNRESPYVKAAIGRIETLMSTQRHSKDAYWHRSMVPKDKARNILARLHEAGKTGEQLLSIVIVIKATQSDLGPWGSPEWQYVQIAKQAKKLRGASGTHFPGATGRFGYRSPRGEGICMRLLGEWIEEKAAYAIDGETIEEVKALVRRKH